MSYLLSIVVPTKNRYKYLKAIIESFSIMDTGEVQLVIQDNSDDNEEILNYIAKDHSKNIKYYYLKKHVSVSENFNSGILQSDGKYVCMLGDDDAVSSKIIDVVKFMNDEDIESAVFNKAFYYWPDMKFRSHRMPSLTIPKYSKRIIEINPLTELDKCLKKGATSLIKLPQIYHGVVKREVLDKIFKKCNTYFPGASPDMAIAVSLSLVVNSHIYVDAPFTISGKAYNSAGGSGARNAHKGKLKDVKWLPNDIEENWEKAIPKVWTGATIYAESAHKALKAMKREDLIGSFNYAYQYAWFRCFNKEYKALLRQTSKKNILERSKIGIYLCQICRKRLFIFIRNIFKTKLNITFDKIIFDVDTSFEASKIITNALNSSEISFRR